MKTKIEIKSLAGSLLFQFEKEDNTVRQTLERAVSERANLEGANLERAYLEGANLEGANLEGANLKGANLEGANLERAYLERANLEGANLEGANLERAYLERANLEGANLEGANLEGANLERAYLERANLEGANLEGANLKGANLEGANLKGANLERANDLPQSYIDICSRDMLFVFEHLKSELPALRKLLLFGKVDGHQYVGSCACLIGSFANIKKQNFGNMCHEYLPYYTPGLHNPGEQWFWQIREGDTPKTNEFAAHALKLIDSVLGKAITSKRGRPRKAA